MRINNHFETSFFFWYSLGGENTCQVMLDTPPSGILFFFGHERVRVSWLYTRLHSYGIHGWRVIRRQLLNLDADRAQSGTDRTSKAKLYTNCHRDTYVEKNLWIPGGAQLAMDSSRWFRCRLSAHGQMSKRDINVCRCCSRLISTGFQTLDDIVLLVWPGSCGNRPKYCFSFASYICSSVVLAGQRGALTRV